MMYREAELTHGRVSMMAALGFFVQEQFHPMFESADGPVIRELDQVLSTSNGMLGGSILLMSIMFSELARARIGWVDPDVAKFELNDGYLPGDLGFDPMVSLTSDHVAKALALTLALPPSRNPGPQAEGAGRVPQDAEQGAQQRPPRDDRCRGHDRGGARLGCQALCLDALNERESWRVSDLSRRMGLQVADARRTTPSYKTCGCARVDPHVLGRCPSSCVCRRGGVHGGWWRRRLQP